MMLGVFTVMSAAPSREAAHFCVASAKTLATHAHRTLLVDLCTECPMLDLALGVGERVLYTARDVLLGAVPLSDALLSPLCKTKKGEAADERILLLPGEVGLTLTEAGVRDLVEGCAALSVDAVIFLSDARTAPLLCGRSDAALLLTDGSEEGLRAALPLCEGDALRGIILSHFVPTAESARRTLSPRALADALGAPLVGILPDSATRTVGDGPSREFLTGTANVTGRMMGEQVPLLRGISIDGMCKRSYLEQ